MTTEILLGIGLVLTLAALTGLTVALVRARKTNTGPDLAQVLTTLQTELACRDGGLDAKVTELNSKLASLQETVASREASLDEQVRGIGERVRGISGLFSNDRARGGWGEISMLRIFELGGLVEGRDFTFQQQTANGTPDALVHLPGGRSLVVDCKFPVARYNEALAADDPEERRRLLIVQGKELEREGRSLVDKGYRELASGGYVVMYVASQAVYEATAETCHEVIERLLEKRVVLAGPSAFYALILSVSALLAEHRGIQHTDQILDEVRELHRRMATFIGHLGGIGLSLGKTVAVFNQAVGSWSGRVGPQLGKLNELSGQDTETELDHIDQVLRSLDTSSYALPADTPRN
jgi:DNA recombination protein RmuC